MSEVTSGPASRWGRSVFPTPSWVFRFLHDQKPNADEILQEVTGARIELEAVADRVREALAAA